MIDDYGPLLLDDVVDMLMDAFDGSSHENDYNKRASLSTSIASNCSVFGSKYGIQRSSIAEALKELYGDDVKSGGYPSEFNRKSAILYKDLESVRDLIERTSSRKEVTVVTFSDNPFSVEQ